MTLMRFLARAHILDTNTKFYSIQFNIAAGKISIICNENVTRNSLFENKY